MSWEISIDDLGHPTGEFSGVPAGRFGCGKGDI